MRICRYELNGQIHMGEVLDDDEHIQSLDGPPLGPFKNGEEVVLRSDVRLLAPVLPSKIVAVGRNYRDHAKEMGKPVPDEPLIFLKATSAILPPGFTIRLPKVSDRVDYEAELAVVIGRAARKVSVQQARDYIFGYTCINDVTARDIQQREVQFTRAKGFDTFAPLGPWIETADGFDPADKAIRCRVNGQLKQNGRTRDMVFDTLTLISYISQGMTLLPGDVIATGTPAGVGPLSAGDTVEVEIEGLGVLSNPVDREAEAEAEVESAA
jgi:2-keto-4-pentenoate hydratase/2-oxohepta-3-ene-1,7-dioic acid hydratase in catechol pathway